VLLGLLALSLQLATSIEVIRGFDDVRMASSQKAPADTKNIIDGIFDNLAGDITYNKAKALKATAPAGGKPGKITNKNFVNQYLNNSLIAY
jgi:hypothetical protein